MNMKSILRYAVEQEIGREADEIHRREQKEKGHHVDEPRCESDNVINTRVSETIVKNLFGF